MVIKIRNVRCWIICLVFVVSFGRFCVIWVFNLVMSLVKVIDGWYVKFLDILIILLLFMI